MTKISTWLRFFPLKLVSGVTTFSIKPLRVVIFFFFIIFFYYLFCEKNINWEIKSDILCALSRSQLIYLKNFVCAWPIHEVCDTSLVKYWSFKTLMFAYCNVANNLFLFSFVALNSYHDPDDFSGTFLPQLGKWAMEIKPNKAPSLGKHTFVFHQFTLQVVCMQIDTFGSSRCHQSLWLPDTHHFTSTSCKGWLSNHAIFSLNDVELSHSAHLSILW